MLSSRTSEVQRYHHNPSQMPSLPPQKLSTRMHEARVVTLDLCSPAVTHCWAVKAICCQRWPGSKCTLVSQQHRHQQERYAVVCSSNERSVLAPLLLNRLATAAQVTTHPCDMYTGPAMAAPVQLSAHLLRDAQQREHEQELEVGDEAVAVHIKLLEDAMVVAGGGLAERGVRGSTLTWNEAPRHKSGHTQCTSITCQHVPVAVGTALCCPSSPDTCHSAEHAWLLQQHIIG